MAEYDARSNESLTLIARGSGDAFDKAYNDAAAAVDDQLGKSSGYDRQPAALWSATEGAQHRAEGRYRWQLKQAVAIAVGATGTADDSVKTLTAFDHSSADQLTSTGDDVASNLSDAQGGIRLFGWFGLPIGILAALLVAWGMSQRLEEYR